MPFRPDESILAPRTVGTNDRKLRRQRASVRRQSLELELRPFPSCHCGRHLEYYLLDRERSDYARELSGTNGPGIQLLARLGIRCVFFRSKPADRAERLLPDQSVAHRPGLSRHCDFGTCCWNPVRSRGCQRAYHSTRNKFADLLVCLDPSQRRSPRVGLVILSSRFDSRPTIEVLA